jgi:formylglycine-generating enzyme required for sulfatase activity
MTVCATVLTAGCAGGPAQHSGLAGLSGSGGKSDSIDSADYTVLGTLSYGDSRSGLLGDPDNASWGYWAYKFTGKPGDVVDVSIADDGGNPYSHLLDANNKVLASGTDTLHLVLPGPEIYTIVFADGSAPQAFYTVKLDGKPAAPAGDMSVPGMVYVPAGTFMMGCNAAIDSQCQMDEKPYHGVTISAFLIDQREVTQADWAVCVAHGKCPLPTDGFDPDHKGSDPVNNVSWQQSADYCNSIGKRLPTEAEWEYSARGTDGRIYPWGNTPPDCTLANFQPCGGTTLPVGTHLAGNGPFGTEDSAGNLLEWTADWYDPNYYASVSLLNAGGPVVDPQGPAAGWINPADPGTWPRHTKRGGAWAGGPDQQRTSFRWNHPKDGPASDIGFRCARSVTPATSTCDVPPAPVDPMVHCGKASCTAGTQACCNYGPNAETCIDPATACGPPGKIQCTTSSQCAGAGLGRCCLMAPIAQFEPNTCPAVLKLNYGGDQLCSDQPCMVEVCATNADCASGHCVRSTLGVSVCGS